MAAALGKKRGAINVLKLRGLPIFQQLQLEEALLRVDDRNWYIWNEQIEDPSIVLGISGKPSKLVDVELVSNNSIPLIKRFSGGGTVIVDNHTIFSSFIIARSTLPQVVPYPRQIMDWTGTFYKPVFDSISKEVSKFNLREDDYVFGDTKVGGNAQSISKDRWVHHTSFLWDFHSERMRYLQIPTKRPDYRGERSHEAFLSKLCDVLPSKDTFYNQVYHQLSQTFDTVVETVTLDEIKATVFSKPHRQATKFIDPYSS